MIEEIKERAWSHYSKHIWWSERTGHRTWETDAIQTGENDMFYRQGEEYHIQESLNHINPR